MTPSQDTPPAEAEQPQEEENNNDYGYSSSDNDIRVYDEELANGDPVLLYVSTEGGEYKAVSVGTGFPTMNQLIKDIEYTMETGSPANHLTPEKAEDLHNAKRVDIFTLAGHVDAE